MPRDLKILAHRERATAENQGQSATYLPCCDTPSSHRLLSPLGMHEYVLLLARRLEILLVLLGSRGGDLKAWEDRQM